MKRLTIALLVFCVFTPSVFAQTVEWVKPAPPRAEPRLSIFSAWLEMVKRAERDYKHQNGRYGDLAALRRAHLLSKLVFESDSMAGTSGKVHASDKAQANFVPMYTLFEVKASEDGQHFTAVIGPKCLSVNADDMGGEWSVCCCWSPFLHRDFYDSPEGPIISVAR